MRNHRCGLQGQRTGSLGDAACMSFYPTKIWAYGDAGMVATNSKRQPRIRTLRNHWQSAKYVSSEPGWNSRLDEIQAAILRVKLRHLPEWQRARQGHAAAYTKLLLGIPGVMPPLIPEGYEHVFHQYTIRVERRDALMKFLSERKIGGSVYYPVHCLQRSAFAGAQAGDFPHAERAAQEVLSLPMFPELRPEQVTRDAEAVAEFVTH
jgi:dTDP-4-amino-4,6-dideoxygalactose transaminase